VQLAVQADIFVAKEPLVQFAAADYHMEVMLI
jgi:hypothetical protein